MQNLDNFTNEQLLISVRNGDGEAFNEVYYRYWKKVTSYASRFVRSREEAEELTQDVFVRLWECRSQIDSSKNFEAYLFTLIRNNFLQALRKKARLTVFRKENLEDEPSCNSIERYIDFKESRKIADQAINTLSPQAKMAYLLSRNNGRSHEEISIQMGISKNTVNNHIKKSLGTIRKYFNDYSPETMLSLLLLTFCL